MNKLKKTITSIIPTLSTLSIFKPAPSARAGYTLVEIAFASFVMGVAFLALVGLGRLAVQNAVDAENDTRSALLAEDIFATLRSFSDTLCATGGPVTWASFWISFTNGTEIVPFQIADEKDKTSARYVDADLGVAPPTPWIYGNGTNTCVKFINPVGVDNSGVSQWTAQFSLSVVATNALYDAYGGREFITGPVSNVTLVTISLHIWPSAYGRSERSRSFYTHIPYKGLHHGQVVE